MSAADRRAFEFLPRLISTWGFCSRKEAERLVAGGHVTVNGVVRRDVLWKTHPRQDAIAVDGQPVRRAALLYAKLHKPLGVVTTMKDPQGRPTVAELVPPERKGVMPVGRLDADSTGLLLLTNDHALGDLLAGADHRVEKLYHVVVGGHPDYERFAPMRAGSVLEDGERCRPARVKLLGSDGPDMRIEVVIDQGKNRQIRRSLAALGLEVRALHRLRIGPLELGTLAPGQVAALSATELAALRRAR